jgi:7,8-dihydroneopterin aldolase/epimerase/oxygenase
MITLQGMRFYAYHGVHPEEQIIGTNYMVDLDIETEGKDSHAAAASDNITKTINYETVYEIVAIEMRKPNKLLETLAYKIIVGCKRQFGGIKTIRVRVHKQNPPLGGLVDWAVFETFDTFTSGCSKCKSALFCYGDKTCWCNDAGARVPSRTLEMLKQQYRGCLCKTCLMSYAF